MSKPTPGPWEFVPKLTANENHHGFFVRAEKATRNGKWALALVQPGDVDGRLGEANARLIAASPDLLEALRQIVSLVGTETDEWDGVERVIPEMASIARVAIAKATEGTK